MVGAVCVQYKKITDYRWDCYEIGYAAVVCSHVTNGA